MHRRENRDRFPQGRVRERDLPRVKGNAHSSVERAQPLLGAIFDVPEDRQASGRKLDSELMTSPRQRSELELRAAFPALEYPKFDGRVLAGGLSGMTGVRLFA